MGRGNSVTVSGEKRKNRSIGLKKRTVRTDKKWEWHKMGNTEWKQPRTTEHVHRQEMG
jgi:hypothetical protein